MTGRSGNTDLPSEGAGAGGKERPNTKRTGELAEAAFLHKAVGLGLKVTKPWGDSERYDFVVDAGERLWRGRIKSTAGGGGGGEHTYPVHFLFWKKKKNFTGGGVYLCAGPLISLGVWVVWALQARGGGGGGD